MSALPAQLQRDDIVFVAFPYTNDGKQPHIKRWNARQNLLTHDDARLQEAINEGQSIGMVGELGSGIVIFDVDDRDAAEKAGVVDACADTFRFSGYADERKFKAVFNVPDLPECMRDGRGKRTLNGTDIFMPCGVGIAEWSTGAAAEKAGGQCVCPPSMHHSGNPYAVTNDVPIKTVSWADIGRFYPPEKEPKATSTDSPRWAHICGSMEESIGDILGLTVSMFLMPDKPRRRSNGEVEGAHPVHGSETGSNLVISADDQSWYCRRCGTGGGRLEALAVAEGIIACEDSRPGCLSGHWKAIFKALKRRGYDTKKLNAGAVAHGAAAGAAIMDAAGGVPVGGVPEEPTPASDGAEGIFGISSTVIPTFSKNDSTEFSNNGIISNSGIPSESEIALPEISNMPGIPDQKYHNSPDTPPVSFNEFPRPAFPVEALPEWLRVYVSALAREVQVPVDLPAMLALSACAGAVSKKVMVAPTRTWREPVNLYVAVALPPAARKSPVLSRIAAPIRDYEVQRAIDARPAIERATARRKLLEARISQKTRECAKAPADELDALTDELTALTGELNALPAPVSPRILADDCTPEKLTNLMADHGGKIAILSAEGGIFEMMGGRYSDGNANLDVYLKGHAGDDIRVDRIGRASDHIRGPALTLGLAIQPDVIAGLGDKRRFRGTGLLARFLYSFPVDNVGNRQIDTPPVPDMVEVSYRACLGALLDIPEGPHALALSDAARGVFFEFSQWVEDGLKPDSEAGLNVIQDWAGKLVGEMLRIAGLLHMAAHAVAGDAWKNPISSETITAAISIAKYLIPHAQMAFGVMQADPEIESAKYLWGRMVQDDRPIIPYRDIWHKSKARFSTADKLDAALNVLVERGYLVQIPVPAAGRGRPMKPNYAKNPAAPGGVV